jgi:hypothetical protein
MTAATNTRSKTRDIDRVFGCTYEEAMALPWPPRSLPWRRNRLRGVCQSCGTALEPRAGWLGVAGRSHRLFCGEHREEADRG